MARVALVTGSNKGIGLALVKLLGQKFNGVVYLTARNPDLGNAALKNALDETEGKRISTDIKFHQLDICSDESVKTLKSNIEKHHGGIDVLINNAAIDDMFSAGFKFNPEIAANVLNTNVVALMRMTDAFVPILRENGRIVQVGSLGGLMRVIPEGAARKKLLDPAFSKQDAIDIINDFNKHANAGDHVVHGYPLWSYLLSKSLVHALTPVYQQELDKMGGNRLINAASPGFTATDMNQGTGNLTPEEGAMGPLYCALLPPGTQSPKGEFCDIDGTVVDWRGTHPLLEEMISARIMPGME